MPYTKSDCFKAQIVNYFGPDGTEIIGKNKKVILYEDTNELINLEAESATVNISSIDGYQFEINRFLLMSLSRYFKNIFLVKPNIPSLILPRTFSISTLIALKVLLAGDEVKVPETNCDQIHVYFENIGISVKEYKSDLQIKEDVPTILWRHVKCFFQYLMYRPQDHIRFYQNLETLPFNGIHEDEDDGEVTTKKCLEIYSINCNSGDKKVDEVRLLTKSGYNMKIGRENIAKWSQAYATLFDNVPNIKHLMIEPEIEEKSLAIFVELLNGKKVIIKENELSFYKKQFEWFDCYLAKVNKRLNQLNTQILAIPMRGKFELLMNQNYQEMRSESELEQTLHHDLTYIHLITACGYKIQVDRSLLRSLSPYFSMLLNQEPDMESIILPVGISSQKLMILCSILNEQDTILSCSHSIISMQNLFSQLDIVSKLVDDDQLITDDRSIILIKKDGGFTHYRLFKPKYDVNNKVIKMNTSDIFHPLHGINPILNQSDEKVENLQLITKTGHSVELSKALLIKWSSTFNQICRTVKHTKHFLLHYKLNDETLDTFTRLLHGENQLINSAMIKYYQEQFSFLGCDLRMMNTEFDQTNTQILALPRTKKVVLFMMNTEYKQCSSEE